MSTTADAVGQSQLLQQMLGIWRECLHTDDIGAEDDFFALGGSSVQAAQIFARLETLAGHPLPLSALYDAPRVADLVDWMLRDGDRRVSRPLDHGHARTIAGAPPARILFVVPGIEGGIVGLGHLANTLAPAVRVVALVPDGSEGNGTPRHDIATIAGDFLDDVRALQPDGPYAFAGLCWGGVVALEMARQLRVTGEAVAPLVLVDPPPVGGRGWTPPTARLLDKLGTMRFLGNRLRDSAVRVVRAPRGKRLAALRERLKVARDVVRQRDAFRGDRAERARYRIHEAHRRSLKTYRRRPYDGDATLVFSGERGNDRSRAGRASWIRYFGNAGQELVVPGRDSGDTVSPGNAAHVARIILDRLPS